MRSINIVSCCAYLVAALFTSSYADAAPVTFYFGGTVAQSGADVTAGDHFTGSYTFESTAPALPGAPGCCDVQYAGITAWTFNTSSLSLSNSNPGELGYFSLANNSGIYGGGDRYIATFGGAGVFAPSGAQLQFIQMDLFDAGPAGDLLSGLSLPLAPPNLSLASFASGRFFTSGATGCQCQLDFTYLSLSPEPPPSGVPAPGAIALLGVGLLGLGTMRRNGIVRQTNPK